MTNHFDELYDKLLKENQRLHNIINGQKTIIEIFQEHIKSDEKIISALYTELKKYKAE